MRRDHKLARCSGPFIRIWALEASLYLKAAVCCSDSWLSQAGHSGVAHLCLTDKLKWFLSFSSGGKPTPYSLFPLLWPSRCQYLNKWKTKTASRRLKLEGALPTSRKPQSSPALTSVQVCLLSSFSNCCWDSFPKISELGTIWIDWLIFWCYLSSLLSQTACVHKGGSRWWVLRPLLAQSEPHFCTQMECIILHSG